MKRKIQMVVCSVLALFLFGCKTNSNDPISSSDAVLVAYFSATGTTESVAEKISLSIGATLYEIVPMIPYTTEDLNYNNSNSRTSQEQNDPTCRPEINGPLLDMAEYDVVLIGYPIWWGEAPKIIYTFLESYDFSGKTILPFCTSGSSGIGMSAQHLASSTNGANWREGRRFSGNVTQSVIDDYLKEFGLIPKKEGDNR